MKTKNIILDFSNNTLEIDYDFIYNFYQEIETITEDGFIDNLNTDFKKSKFIKINFKFINEARKIKIRDRFTPNINIDYFRSISNNNLPLSLDDRRLFNTLNKIDNYFYINEDVKDSSYTNDSDIKTTLSYFNLSNDLDFYKNSNCVYYNKNLASFIKNSKSNTNVLQNKNIENIETYKSVLNTEDFNENFNSNIINYIPNISNNLFSYSEIESDNNKRKKAFIGILTDKFIKDEDDYKLKSSTFYFTQNHFSNFSREINDVGVKYGRVYKYVFYPVYFYSRPTIDEGLTLSDYLICDTPSITEDILCVENIRPTVIGNLRGKYFENRKSFKLRWSQPAENQNDIKGFQIFKRTSLDEPFMLVKQLEGHSNIDFYDRNENISKDQVVHEEGKIFREYYDDTFNPTDITIYTICSIDAHGLTSSYSEQIAFTYDFLNKKTIADLVSTSGAPIFYPNLFVPRKTIFFDNDDKLSTITPSATRKTKFTLMFTPDCLKHDTEQSSQTFEKLFKNEYEFSIFRLNNRSIYEDKISINYNEQEQ